MKKYTMTVLALVTMFAGASLTAEETEKKDTQEVVVAETTEDAESASESN